MLRTGGGSSLGVRRESSVHVEQLYEIKIMITVHLVGFNFNSYASSSSSVASLSKKDKHLPGCCPPSSHFLSHSSPVNPIFFVILCITIPSIHGSPVCWFSV